MFAGVKISKKWLPVLFYVSMKAQVAQGSVFGYRQIWPRAFKQTSVAELPVVWKSNRRGWMTIKSKNGRIVAKESSIFGSWVRKHKYNKVTSKYNFRMPSTRIKKLSDLLGFTIAVS